MYLLNDAFYLFTYNETLSFERHTCKGTLSYPFYIMFLLPLFVQIAYVGFENLKFNGGEVTEQYDF